MNGLKISEIINLNYVGLLGCNSEFSSLIEDFYKQNYKNLTHPIYFFYEYLLHNPLPHSYDINQKDNTYFIAPFIQRFSKKNSFGFDPSDSSLPREISSNYKIKALEEEDIIKSQIVIDLSKSQYMKKLFDHWTNSRPVKNIFKKDYGFYYYDMDYTKEKLVNYINDAVKEGIADDISNKSKYFEGGFIKSMIGSWPSDLEISTYVFPIASKNLFYGEIILWIPKISSSNPKQINKSVEHLIQNLFKIISTRYIPILSIIHEHIIESNIKEGEKKCTLLLPKNKNVDYYNCYLQEYLKTIKKDSSFMEDSIIELWEKRAKRTVNYEESLIFKKYLIASPKMLDLIKDVIRKAKLLKKSGDALPSVLIVGDAGSGKNNFVDFLKIFSPHYSKGNTYFQNMAGMKPDNEVPSILMGIDSKDGIFGKIRSDTINFINKDKNEDDKRTILANKEYKNKNPIFPTIVLDELNSLNIESQGILLRFIDNSEIIKIGDIHDVGVYNKTDPEYTKRQKSFYTDFLIIGIMNEEPDELSRESAVNFLSNNEYIKGLVSDIFYEYILKIRRLRPDIKYRMVRSGKFVIPKLKDRTYDIPILFYVFLKSNIQYPCDLHISFTALEKLIDKTLDWSGNIRQLQALCKIVANEVDNEKKVDRTDKKVVTYHMIEKGLQAVNLI